MIILCFLLVLWLLAAPELRTKLTKLLLALVIFAGVEFLVSTIVFAIIVIHII